MIAFDSNFFAKKMPHLVVPARLFCTMETKPTPTTTPKTPPSPTRQNTVLTHSTHTSRSLMHTPNRSPSTRRCAQTLVTNMHSHKQTSRDRFFDGCRVAEFVMTDGPAQKRQLERNNDDTVYVPVRIREHNPNL